MAAEATVGPLAPPWKAEPHRRRMTASVRVPHDEVERCRKASPVPWRWVARVVVVAPIVVAVARALSNHWFPIGDDALLTLRAADVFTRHHPLLGSWTSASLALGTDVNNPGPLYSDLLAPFMWTFGKVFGYGPGVAIGVGAINVACALATTVVAARLGGWRAERWMLVLVAALTWAMGSELLFDIWQPHALLLPFVLLLMLTVGVACGDGALAPWWFGVLSVVVQTHIGFAYVGVALVAVAAIATAHRRRTEGRALRAALTSPAAAWSVGVVAVAWAQPIREELFGEGRGNLSRLAGSAGAGDVTLGLRNAVRLLGAVFVTPPAWTRWGFDDVARTAPLEQTPDGPRLTIAGLPGLGISAVGLVAMLALLGWLVAVLREPAQRLVRWAVGLGLVLMVVAVGTLTVQVVGVTGLGSHQVRWTFALAAYVHVVAAWGLVEHLWLARPVARDRPLDGAVLAVVGVLVVANLGYHAQALGPVGDRRAADTLRPVFADLAGFEPNGPVVYDVAHLTVYEAYSAAVIMRLDEVGVDVRLDDEGYLRQYGPGRRAGGTEPVRLFQYEREAALLYAGKGCVVSRHAGVTDEVAAATDSLIAAAVGDLVGRPIDSSGLPPDVAALTGATAAGDDDSANRLVMRALLPVLVTEGRVAPTPAIDAAVAANADIVARVNTTLAIVAEPASACE